MAETLTQRLQRIAAEKKAAAAVQVKPAESVTEVTSDDGEQAVTAIPDHKENAEVADATVADGNGASTGTATEKLSTRNLDRETSSGRTALGERKEAALSGLTESKTSNTIVEVPESNSSDGPDSNSGSTHPLVMEFAELSQALDARDPEFKVILRKIHQQLGKDPDLVTQMTEKQIQQIVTGMIVFANAEIVAPAKAKSEKALVTAAKKKVINVDDL